MIGPLQLRRILELVLVVLFVVNATLTYRACRTRETEPDAPVIAQAGEAEDGGSVAPTPAPTPPPPPDPNPERTLILTAMTFFQHISDRRYDEASSMFRDDDKRRQWSENLRRVAKMGNPIAAFEIEEHLNRPYCKSEIASGERGSCSFPILLYRKDRNISEWASIKMELAKVDGEWRITYYEQIPLDKDAYDARRVEEERRAQAAREAREKLQQNAESP
ncbi:MAG: hypothetical protein IT350_11150 [Deltaproteobacteria bacterium]|nr:hypothetical protein [Deltaproteobacteria bacterium]